MPINYSDIELEQVKVAGERIKKALQLKNLENNNDFNKEFYEKQFIEALSDDFNTAKALAVIFNLVKELNKKKSLEAQTLLLEFLSVLGLEKFKQETEVVTIPKDIQQLAQERWEAKVNKSWELADNLRKELQEKGYSIKDNKDGYEILEI
jgi:cysteinyl-tRNA synthetase